MSTCFDKCGIATSTYKHPWFRSQQHFGETVVERFYLSWPPPMMRKALKEAFEKPWTMHSPCCEIKMTVCIQGGNWRSTLTGHTVDHWHAPISFVDHIRNHGSNYSEKKENSKHAYSLTNSVIFCFRLDRRIKKVLQSLVLLYI